MRRVLLILALVSLPALVRAQNVNIMATDPSTGDVVNVGNVAANSIRVIFGATQTVNIGTTGGLALDATLTGGTAKAIVRGGAKGATVAGDVTATDVDANHRAIDVNIAAGANVGGTSSTDKATFTYSTTAQTPAGCVYNSSVTALSAGQSGAVLCTANREVAVEIHSGGVAITPSTDIANDAAITIGTTAGPLSMFRASTSVPSAVSADNDAVHPWADRSGRLQVNGDSAMTPILIAQGATTTAGQAASACNILATASTNATLCKNATGNLYGYELFNTTTTVYYLRIYNLGAAPTCSSATGFVRSIPIPPGAAAGQVGGAVSNFTVPTNFSTGLGYCLTGGGASTDNTNAAAGVFGEIRYK